MAGGIRSAIGRVCVVGAGVIGAGWAARYLAHGLDVVATDPAPDAEERLRAVVGGVRHLADEGTPSAVLALTHPNATGPRPEGRLRSPSSSPVSAAGKDRGLNPASDGRSLMAVFAAGTGVNGVICGSLESAATGSPGLGMRAAMIRHAMIPAVMTAPASAAAISATRMVGVPGHAWPVRQRDRLMTQRSPNGGMRRPDSAAAMRAASQASQAATARPQPISTTTQTPAPLPARSGIRGPAARVTIPAPGPRPPCGAGRPGHARTRGSPRSEGSSTGGRGVAWS